MTWALLAALAVAGPGRLLVAPLSGVGPEVTESFVEALRELEFEVVDLGALASSMGDGRLERCDADPCLVSAAKALAGEGRLLAGEVLATTVRVRLFEGGEDRPRLQVSRQIGPTGPAAALRASIPELFSAEAARALAPVLVEGLPPGAEVRIGDSPPVAAPSGRLSTRLRPGSHSVEVRAPGHRPWTGTVDVAVGDTTRVVAEPSKRRSPGPWVVGGVGLAAAVAGAVVHGVAEARAAEWSDACSAGRCDPGFTRARYLEDEGNIERERAAALGLVALAAAAVAGAALWALFDPGQEGPDGRFGEIRF